MTKESVVCRRDTKTNDGGCQVNMKNKLISPDSARERGREMSMENSIAQQSYSGWDEMGVNIHSFVVKVQQAAQTLKY